MTADELRGIATKWKAEIRLYEREFEKWETRGQKVVDRYLDERRASGDGMTLTEGARFNILWSNVETQTPAVYARTPKPDVSRRYRDRDPAGRVASMIVERCLQFETDQYTDYDSAMKAAVEDRLLPGRGAAWVRYEPTFRRVPVVKTNDQGDDEVVRAGEPTTGQITDDVTDYEDELAHECTPVDYVHWKDFGHSSARTWEEVPAVWRRVYMDRNALKERFGDNAAEFKYNIDQIPLDAVPEQLKDERLGTSEGEYKLACVYEIWDKKKKRALWVHKNVSVPLDMRDDPLKLDGFFPCPKPLYATTGTGKLVPVPDFCMYQDQAEELDVCTERIAQLQKAVKVVGIYDATQDGVKRMLNEGVNNTMIPCDTWAAFGEKGGLKGVVDFLPLDMVVKALDALYVARESILQVIYQISGLSDIVRGSTDPDETLGAQQIKANYAGLRIKRQQKEVARFARDLLRLKAEIMCEFYSPETLISMSGVMGLSEVMKNPAIVQEAIALLKNDVLRDFRIDIESDSMVQIDEQQEKEAATEFVTGLGALLEKSLPIVQAAPQLIGPVGETISMVMRKFGAGKTVEAAWDEALDLIREEAKKPKEPPPPPPEVLKAQADAQKEAAIAQREAQQGQMDMQREQLAAQEKAQLDAQQKNDDLARDAQQKAQERALKDMELQKADEFNRWKVVEDNNAKIRVAEIAAAAAREKAEMAAEAAAEQSDTVEEPAGNGTYKKASRSEKASAKTADNVMQAVKPMIAELAERIDGMSKRDVVKMERVKGGDGRLAKVRRHHADGTTSEVAVN